MEPVGIINHRLKDYFGVFENGDPNWKIFWSEEFIEKTLVTHTNDGFELLTPYVQERKKANYIKDRYVLTRLVPVPEEVQYQLCGAKVSYEPIWTFEDSYGNALPPDWEVIYLLIKTWNENVFGPHTGFAKYKLPEGMGNTKEEIAARVDKLQEELFGNETSITDALKNDSAVGYGIRQRKDWMN